MSLADRFQLAWTPLLKKHKELVWEGISDEEYARLFARFSWLWTPERIHRAQQPGSFARECEKKISYLRSLVSETV